MLVDCKERPVEVSVDVEQRPAVGQGALPPRGLPLRRDRGHLAVGDAGQGEALALLDGEEAELGGERQLGGIEEPLGLACVWRTPSAASSAVVAARPTIEGARV